MTGPVDDEAGTRRRKLIGRVVILLFGLLALAYAVADITYRMQMR